MSALDNPVLVPLAEQNPDESYIEDAEVRPSDVLAALDDEQREALVERIIPTYARQERLSATGDRVRRAARAVVDALCGEAKA